MKALFDGTIDWWSWNIAFAWKPSVTSSRLDWAGTNRYKECGFVWNRRTYEKDGFPSYSSYYTHNLTIWIRASYWAWGCSIAILVYQRVESQGRIRGRDAFPAFQCFQALFSSKELLPFALPSCSAMFFVAPLKSQKPRHPMGESTIPCSLPVLSTWLMI